MFARLVWRLLRGNAGRLTVALVAMASGAAVISALLNMQYDVQRKMTQEFRSLGANLVVSRAAGGDQKLASEKEFATAIGNDAPAGMTAAPFVYVVARTAAQREVVVAGTSLELALQLSPTWKIRGTTSGLRDDATACLVGERAAQTIGVQPGGSVELHVGANALNCRVAAVIAAGDDEDNQIFVPLRAAQALAGLGDQIELMQARVPGSAKQIEAYAARIQAGAPEFQARPIRQIAESEGALLGRVQLLIFSMAALIFVLTALSVLATMTALAMERRADVGLMKALGGSIQRIVGLFLAEVSVLGAAGGVIGYLIGAALTIWIGRSVFGVAISPRPEVLPLIVALMMAVALAGALPLRFLGRVKPAAILRGE
jgi:putative ABC transport system permease protein